MSDRTPRSSATREKEQRKQSWSQPALLPLPDPQEGYEFRYIRSSMLGQADNVNVSAKFREGWEPVPASEVPELKIMNDHDSRFPDNVEIGGLILCRAPTELLQERREHFARAAQGQLDAVDRNYMRENDPRMPLLAPERQTRISRFRED